MFPITHNDIFHHHPRRLFHPFAALMRTPDGIVVSTKLSILRRQEKGLAVWVSAKSKNKAQNPSARTLPMTSGLAKGKCYPTPSL